MLLLFLSFSCTRYGQFCSWLSQREDLPLHTLYYTILYYIIFYYIILHYIILYIFLISHIFAVVPRCIAVFLLSNLFTNYHCKHPRIRRATLVSCRSILSIYFIQKSIQVWFAPAM